MLFFFSNSPTRTLAVLVSRSHTMTHTYTYTYTHTQGRTPLDEWSARRRSRYVRNTRQTQKTKRACPERDSNLWPRNQAAANLGLWPHSHRDRRVLVHVAKNTTSPELNINTRWFKYDRDDLCLNRSQFVPVIFEPPCIIIWPVCRVEVFVGGVCLAQGWELPIKLLCAFLICIRFLF
jgi:hypothetical protein